MSAERSSPRSGKDVIKALREIGYVHVKTRGDHAKMRRNSPKHTVVVPLYDEIDVSLLDRIISQIEKGNPGVDVRKLIYGK